MASKDVLRKLSVRRWYEGLAVATADREDLTFLNYGYASLDGTSFELNEAELTDRFAVQLYLHLLSSFEANGARRLAHKRVLEVGSGRGGGAALLHRRFGPRSTIGLDLSPAQVELSRAAHEAPGLEFVVGDAERLPFPDESFDFVLNVESSHGYGSFARFLEGVARVLVPGGFFVIADFRPTSELPALRLTLESTGLHVVHEEDLTDNVAHALALGDDTRKRMSVAGRIADPVLASTFAEFAGEAGTTNFEALSNKEARYFAFQLEKPGPAPARAPKQLRARGLGGTGTLEALGNDFDRLGDLLCLPIEDTDVIYVRHPDLLERILVSASAAFEKRSDDLSPLLGKGLLTTDGELWRSQRRRIQPSFKSERVAAYAQGFTNIVARRVSGWRDGATIDLLAEMRRITLEIVVDALFEHDIAPESERIGEAMIAFQNASLPAPEAVRQERRAVAVAAHAEVCRIIEGVVEAGRARGPGGRDMLSQLLLLHDDEGSMSTDELRDHLLTFFLAGHETTSCALTWIFHLLGLHPRQRARVEAEADERGRERPYARAVALEALRLYPPAYALPRLAREPVSLGDRLIGPGAQVIACVYHCQRDGRWFDRPREFLPERFLPGVPLRNPKAYLPFGAGPRACIGKHFALLELEVVIGRIAEELTLEAASLDLARPITGITLVPDGPIEAVVRRRA
ncbi:MAG: cytochrome P450 [Deltaproteobacteria bacterium]|nr:cytochrome P450 [Deltaproteobacteria bacterium]